MATAPQFAKGADAQALDASLQPLLASSGGRWALTSTGEGLERSFKFKTFAKTWVSTFHHPVAPRFHSSPIRKGRDRSHGVNRLTSAAAGAKSLTVGTFLRLRIS